MNTDRLHPAPRSAADLLAAPASDYMSPAQREFFRDLLRAEAAALRNAAEATTHHLQETEAAPDPTDRASAEEEHTLELRVHDRERKLLKKIEQALQRIENGSYGWCEERGEPITKIGEDLVMLDSSCICCTVRGNLTRSLTELFMKRLHRKIVPISRMVVETTGLAFAIYRDFGFDDVAVKRSTRPANRIGSDETRDQLEGAFYGPKLEFVLRDAIGRDWQSDTLQVDLNLPERFDIHYINEHGERERPVMPHRALFGSLERFTGILIEHYSGLFPLWLAPQQAVVLNISEGQADYAAGFAKRLRQAGLSVGCDLGNEKTGHKIRQHTLQKAPNLLVVGEQEKAEGRVTLRSQAGDNLGSLSLDELVARQRQEARTSGQGIESAC